MTPTIWTDPRYVAVLRLLRARTGMSFRPHERDRVERGIQTAMQRSGQSDLVDYRRLLEHDSDAWDQLIVELTVGETYFFRESSQFAFIQEEVLPELLERRGPRHRLRFWSAGCASGEEAYSLAMLLEQEGLLQRSHILATDISTAALAKAREAVYADWSFRGPGASRAEPYFFRRNELNVLDEPIRSQVDFEMLNLAVDSYPMLVSGTRNLDLIMCRNVLIYFDSETVASIAQRFHAALAPGGWLITSSADPLLENYAPLQTIVRSSGLYYRRAPAVVPTVASVQRAPALAGTDVNESFGDGRSLASTRPPKTGDDGSVLRPSGTPTVQPAPTRPVENSVSDARRALIDGRYALAIALTENCKATHDACVIRVQALANTDIARAEHACASACTDYPLSTDLHYLHAALLLENGRIAEATEAVRRVIYLDRKLVVAYMLLGSCLRQLGDLSGALRALRNASNLCLAQRPDELVPLSDGETAGHLTRAIKSQLEGIQAARGASA